MSLVLPIVGHLCSKYAQTAVEGLRKIREIAVAGSDQFLSDFIQDSDAMNALYDVANRSTEALAEVLETLRVMIEAAPKAIRPVLVADLCTAKRLSIITKVLSSAKEETLHASIAAMTLIESMVVTNPGLVLQRLNGVPLTFACFQNQLPYGMRRLHAPRLRFLIACATTKHLQRNAETVCGHGFLTLLVDDAAALLQQQVDTSHELILRVLDVFLSQFAQSAYVTVEKKREVLLGQRNIFRILIKALELPDPKIRDAIAQAIMAVVKEVVEPSADYATVHVRDDDRGMTNFVVFLILRLLRPKQNVTETQLVVFILHHAPDLVRPYFSRVVRQLLETDGSSDHPQSLSSSARTSVTASIINLLTRCSLAPIPFHLKNGVATLQTNEVPARTFFTLTPKALADEICPPGLGEYVHKMINHSTNLLHLVWAIQVTTSTLLRALHIKRLVTGLQDRQRPPHAREDYWDVFDGQVDSALAESLPRREEFWHRVTQQLHHILVNGITHPQHGKAHFAMQRMLVLMNLYTDLFNIRTSWLTAAPSIEPTLSSLAAPSAQRSLNRSVAMSSATSMKQFLTTFEDPIAASWPAKSVSSLCMILCANLTRCVSLPKIHHISFGTPAKAPRFVTDYPVLLSLLLWFVRHSSNDDDLNSGSDGEIVEARAWITRLTLWCVHGVSIRFAASAEEVYLWLSHLTVETIPTFLHLLNSMLQRSTSKFADQVADHLAGGAAEDLQEGPVSGSSGTLLREAQHFLSKTKEKYFPETSSTVVAVGETQAKPAAAKELDVWQKDMKDNLPHFEQLIGAVEQTTAQARNKLYRRDISKKMRQHMSVAQSGKKVVEQAVILEGSRHNELQPDHEIVVHFFESGLVPAIDDDGPLGLSEKDLQTGESLAARLLPREAASAATLAPWLQRRSGAWQVATVLREWLSLEEDHSSDRLVDVATFAKALLKHLRCSRDQWREVDWMASDCTGARGTNGLGILVMLLTLLQPLLVLKKTAAAAILSDALLEDVSLALSASYTATLSCRDRIKYAILVCLDRLHSRVPIPSETGAAHNLAADEVEETEPAKTGEDDEQQQQQRPSVSAKRARLTQHQQFVGWSDMAVPVRAISSARYAIGGTVFPTGSTGEIAALSQLVQSWSDADVLQIAEKLPLRMRTAVFFRADHSSKMCDNALSMCFPEAHQANDRRACDMSAICDEAVIDPRYLFPLLSTCAAIGKAHPGLVKPHLLRKCFPILLRSLSCLDPKLRELGTAVLAMLPRNCLTNAERSLLNFARLRVISIVISKVQSGIAMEAQATVPRLATPISAFLLTALAAMKEPQASLHNHVINFFLSEDLLTDSLPLHRLLHHFPINCVTNTLMLQQQSELQKEESENVAAASKSLTNTLKREAGAHLIVLMHQVGLSVATKSDFFTVMSHNAICDLGVLASCSSSVPELRRRAVEALVSACLVCHEVASAAANAAHLPLFCCELARQVMQCLGDDSADFHTHQRFFGVLMYLLRKLLRELSSQAECSQLQFQLLRMEQSVKQLRVTSEATVVAVQKALSVFDTRNEKKKRLRESVQDVVSATN